MSDHDEHQSRKHPLAAPPTLMSEAPAPRPAATSSAATAGHAPRLPTKDELLAPHAPDTANASSALLLVGIQAHLTSVFDGLLAQLPETIKALAEPPAPPEPGVALALIGFLVETATGLVLGSLGSSLAMVAKKKLGELAVEPFKGVLKAGAHTVGGKAVAAAAGGLATGIPGNRSLPANTGGGYADPSAKTLLDEFRKRQLDRLLLARADATMTLGGVAEKLSAYAHADIEGLLLEIRGATADAKSTISTEFSHQLTVGWMNLTASLALGPKGSPEAPDMPGANETDGIRGETELAAWRGAHHGFVEVIVNLPEVLRGTLGLELSRVSVPTSPGTARMLQRMERPLMGIPVYRRISLVQPGQGALLQSPAVVITPEGNIETDASNEQLAAIGAGVETASIDTWSRLGEGASAGMRGTYAVQGARMLAAWLGLFPASVIR